MARITPEVKDLIAEFEWTRSRHGGDIAVAAGLLGMTPAALEAALRRANRIGEDVEFTTRARA